jgi:hypothetical protein
MFLLGHGSLYSIQSRDDTYYTERTKEKNVSEREEEWRINM